ncbi:hypothetical protein GCM10018954_037100 [Kutzneria kofuensis]
MDQAELLVIHIDDVDLVVRTTGDRYEITKRVAERLSALPASGYQLPPEFTRASEEHHVNYPLYIDPDDSWCVASVAWNVGQRTPVHGHETWASPASTRVPNASSATSNPRRPRRADPSGRPGNRCGSAD